ncbi:Terpene cyclase [Mycena venus]|uniref:Terpene cyclase n=1 Tax=Mycena venus TaxID=2733690 RepID=A0A8H6YC66_9AGAR|nr:Terpene cyclase [Mycena venus]
MFNSYFEVCRETIGSKPAYAICEMHMNIPDNVMKHPVIVKLENLCTDAIIINNNLFSYNVKQACGDEGHNLVYIVMHQFSMDVQATMNWISDLHNSVVDKILKLWRDVPIYRGPMDRQVRTYVDGLANWVRANDSWSFEV